MNRKRGKLHCTYEQKEREITLHIQPERDGNYTAHMNRRRGKLHCTYEQKEREITLHIQPEREGFTVGLRNVYT
jgi:hypothetical protein